MLKKLRLILIKMLLLRRKDVSTILISLGFAEEEYDRRYNDPEHPGFKSSSLKDANKDLQRLQDDFAYMLGIKNYSASMNNYKNKHCK